MLVTIRPSPGGIGGVIAAPPSKSMAHRAVLCAALAVGRSHITHLEFSKDISATLSAAAQLCAAVDTGADDAIVQGLGHFLPLTAPVDCCESGSTLRFLIPIASLTGQPVTFTGRGRLMERPQSVYESLYCEQNLRFEQSPAGLTVEGALTPGDYRLAGNVSSQFVSGLLFALPLLPGNSTLTVQQPVESESYIRMTIEAIAASGIEVQESNAFSWRIPGHQQYKSHSCHLNGDYSQAAVLCCAGALGHDITVTHLSPVTTQGDRAILRHLMALGATVEEGDNHIRVKADKLHGATLDMHDCPDIAPILALTAQLAEGESRLTHCGRLRLKECDRLAATVEILNLLGGDAKADGDDIVLHGVKQLRGGVTLPNYGDHRMVMLASIAATKCEQPIEMDGIEAIDKSWPEYLKVYQMLGGKCE